jgi:hypothetical protein
MADKTYRVLMSDRCFRFKPDAIPSHAPGAPGVYEFVTFDAERNAKVLFVGCELKNMAQALTEHWMGTREPSATKLFENHKDVYFDYVARSNAESAEDLKDIAGALIKRHSPTFNGADSPATGRFQDVEVKEVEVL